MSLRPIYTCDFRRDFCRKYKVAAISMRFLCNWSGTFVAHSQKSPPSCINFPTYSKPLGQITLKSPLLYTCDFHRELEYECDEKCIEECNKNCTKNRIIYVNALTLLFKPGPVVYLAPPIHNKYLRQRDHNNKIQTNLIHTLL